MGAHDVLFKRAFRLPAHAAGELAAVLPPELSKLIDLSSLEPVETSFVKAEPREIFADALFRAKFRDLPVPGYVGFLIEHRSNAARLMMLRVLQYFTRHWIEYVRETHARDRADPRVLPPIVCVIVHHGESGWTAPRRFHELVEGLDIAPELRKFVPDFEIIVDDLVDQSDEALHARPLSAFPKVVLWALRDGRNIDVLLAHLETWAAELGRMVAEDPQGVFGEDVVGVMRYILEVAGERPFEQVQRRVVEVVPAAEVPMSSAAEQLIQEGVRRGKAEGEAKGKAEGKAEGEAKGKAEGILDVLDARGLTVSDEQRARILACTDVAELARWLRAAATAGGTDELFTH